MTASTPDPTPAQLLARAEQRVTMRRAGYVEEFDIVLGWLDLHSEPPALDTPGGEQLLTLGGDGTPPVRDLCLAELAIARSEHLLTTRALAADLLDLRHRLPLTWTQVRALRLEGWIARRAARLSRSLSRDAVRVVDAAVAAAAGQAPSRILAIVEAKIIEADPEVRAEQINAARTRKGVWITATHDQDGQDGQPGMRSLYARLEAADATWIDATVQRVADLLAADPDLRALHHPELGEHPTPDELRAAGLAWLARPHDLAQLLGVIDEQHTDQLARRRHSATLYLHLHRDALTGTAGVARTTSVRSCSTRSSACSATPTSPSNRSSTSTTGPRSTATNTPPRSKNAPSSAPPAPSSPTAQHTAPPST